MDVHQTWYVHWYYGDLVWIASGGVLAFPVLFFHILYEPPSQTMYCWSFVHKEGSAQPAYPHSLTSLSHASLAIHRASREDWSDCQWTGWSESLLGAHGSCTKVHFLALQFISFLVLSFTLLTLDLLNPDIPCLCKQCRSRSVGFWRSQLIWICTVCHSVFEFISTTWIKQSDWLKIGNGRGISIYSAGQGLTFQKHIFIAGISLISPWKHTVLT